MIPIKCPSNERDSPIVAIKELLVFLYAVCKNIYALTLNALLLFAHQLNSVQRLFSSISSCHLVAFQEYYGMVQNHFSRTIASEYHLDSVQRGFVNCIHFMYCCEIKLIQSCRITTTCSTNCIILLWLKRIILHKIIVIISQ